MYLRLFFSSSLFFCIYSSFAQNGNIAFKSTDMPVSLQLFQRDSTNKSIVPFIGKIIDKGYDKLSLIVQKDSNTNYYNKINLQYGADGMANFAFNPQIQAGLYNYTFSLYAFKGKDSSLVTKIERVLCGDVIVIYGQSNALATVDLENYQTESANIWGRTLNTNALNFLPAFSWTDLQLWNYFMIGTIGTEISRLIRINYKMPTCILNEAVGNTSVLQLSDRDSSNIENLTTNYGLFMHQIVAAKVKDKVAIILWRQGEKEAYDVDAATHYPENFDRFYKMLHKDLKSLKKIYSFQNNIYNFTNDNASLLRDFQRREQEIYPDVSSLATVGTVGYQGLHYYTPGYIESAQEVTKLIGRDFFMDKDTSNCTSSDIKKCFFSKKQDTLTIVFEANQKMVYPSAKLNSFFYVDNNAVAIDTAWADKNRIIFKLKNSIQGNSFSYLPSYFPVGYFYDNGYLTNIKGIRALTFSNFPIAKHLETTNFQGNVILPNTIQVSWTQFLEKGAKTTLERSTNNSSNFQIIAQLPQENPSYQDQNLDFGTTYYYRIKTISPTSESNYSNILKFTIPPITINASANFVFPNGNQLSWAFNNAVSQQLKMAGAKTVIERSKNNTTDFQIIAQLTSDKSAYQDSNLDFGAIYYYRLKVNSTSYLSNYSDILKTTIPPLNLETTATYLLPNNALIAWQISSSGISLPTSTTPSVTINRSKKDTLHFQTIANFNKNETNYLDENLSFGDTFYYQLKVNILNSSTIFSSIQKINVPFITAIENNNLDSQINVFPNPSSNGIFYLKNVISVKSFTIFDSKSNILGQMQGPFKENQMIHIENKGASLNLIQFLTNENQLITKKIIIQ